MNYYNEFDPKAAAWLRELIAAGLIPRGEVDERSITEISPHELTGYTQQHFFAGIGGWPLALRLAGWPDARPVRTGSCPCQPFSSAGKQLGEKDPRHLWPVFRDLITFGEATVTFGEQVASAAGRVWLAGIRADLEGMGYAVGAGDLCSAGVGSPNMRQRLYWMAHAPDCRWAQQRHEPRQRNSPSAAHTAECSGPRGLADSCASGWRALQRAAGEDRRPAQQPYRCSDARGLADTDGRQSGDLGIQSGREHRQQPPNGGAGGLGDSDNAGSQGRIERGERPAEWTPWTASMALICTDGKARRIEPGSFPLAHGIPGRVGLLRGYGNAINPWLAAEFILACEEALT